MPNAHSILVAIDLDKNAETILEKAYSLAQSTAAALRVIHVFKPLGHSYTSALTLGQLEENIESWNSELALKVQNDLHALTAKFKLDDDHIHIKSGHAASTIMSFANELGSDLIVLGKHSQRTGHLGAASTSSYLIHQCKQDLLLVTPVDD
jgi:universal stress protein A